MKTESRTTEISVDSMELRHLPLSMLEPSKANPRKHKNGDALEGLAASIASDGVLQSLTVKPNGGDTYHIVSGNRRYSALKWLLEDGQITADYPIPVQVMDKGLTKHDALRVATVENVQRQALPPMDEAEAFARLVRTGTSIDDISVHTGVSSTTIKRRLALAALCPEAKKALRKDEISLSQAQALTLGTHTQQSEALQLIEESPSDMDADGIHHILTESRPTQAMAIFPLEEYDGGVTSDLFGDPDTTFFDDAEQFGQLQDAAVENLVSEHQESAQWVEVIREYHCPTWLYDQAEEGEPAGTLIHYPPTGKVEVHTGLKRRETAPPTDEVLAQDKPKQKPEYSGTAVRYMAAHKSLAVQAALISSPDTALQVIAAQMLSGYGVQIKAHAGLKWFERANCPTRAMTEIEAIAAPLSKAFGAEGTEDYPSWWILLNAFDGNPEAAYAMVKTLSPDEVQTLLSLLAVLTFGQESQERVDTSGTSFFTTVAADLAVQMRQWWLPDEVFLKTRNTAQLVAIAHASGASTIVGPTNKKADLVKKLVAHFERMAAMMKDTGENAILARSWLPDAMGFTPPEDNDDNAGDDT